MAWLSFVWLAATLMNGACGMLARHIDVAEQLATKSDLNGARDAYSVATRPLTAAEVGSPTTALSTGGAVARLPVLVREESGPPSS